MNLVVLINILVFKNSSAFASGLSGLEDAMASSSVGGADTDESWIGSNRDYTYDEVILDLFPPSFFLKKKIILKSC
jgi:hypothetical protein